MADDKKQSSPSAEARRSSKLARTARFITAAQQLAEEQGIENISIRKIAEVAGYHNSTIYTYFNDADLLLSLACVPFFADYTKALAHLSQNDPSAYDRFFAVWTYFCESAFKRPDAFRLFFFGKYSHNLTELLNQYYEIFPEEKAEYSQVISDMYYSNSFSERCLALLSPLVEESESTRVNRDNILTVNTIIASVFHELLESKCADPSLDDRELISQFMGCLHYLVDM